MFWSNQQKFSSESINDTNIQKQTSEPTTEFSIIVSHRIPTLTSSKVNNAKKVSIPNKSRHFKTNQAWKNRMSKFSTQWIAKWSLQTEIQTWCQTWPAKRDRTPCDKGKGWEFWIEKKKNSPLQVMTVNAKKESLMKAKWVRNNLQVA